jgi:hypothetical protein
MTINAQCQIPKLSTVDPISSGTWSEGKAMYGISVDFVIELEEDTEADMCKNSMCGPGKNVRR